MTFDAREEGLSTGQPVRLYEFRLGPLRWRYAAADRDVEHDGEAFAATAISDNGIRQTGEASTEELKVSAPHDLAVARLFRGAPPAGEVELVIFNRHHNESEARVGWSGSVVAVLWPSEERSELRCQTLSASFGRPGLRLGWERGCPHALYDHLCRVDRELFRVDTAIASMDGLNISSAAFDTLPDGWFAGGYIEWEIGDGAFDRRAIEAHTGATLRIFGGTAGLADDLPITAYPGCARTAQVCAEKFDNIENYGGVPHMPGKSPFDGDPVF